MTILAQIKLEALPEEVPEGIEIGKRAKSSISSRSIDDHDSIPTVDVDPEDTEKS